MKHRLLIYIPICIAGIILSAIGCVSSEIKELLLSIGTGLFTAALTGFAVDFINYLGFNKRRNYRRKIELHYLSFDMLITARSILNNWDIKNPSEIKNQLLLVKISDDNIDEIVRRVNIRQKDIISEFENIKKIQDYLSLSQFFTDQEVVFLCRSINHYQSISRDNVKYVIKNIIEYIDMFKDTLQYHNSPTV